MFWGRWEGERKVEAEVKGERLLTDSCVTREERLRKISSLFQRIP